MARSRSNAKTTILEKRTSQSILSSLVRQLVAFAVVVRERELEIEPEALGFGLQTTDLPATLYV